MLKTNWKHIIVTFFIISLNACSMTSNSVDASWSASSEMVSQFQNEVGSLNMNEMDYFLDVALASEHGNNESVIKKWTQDPVIRILGDVSSEDLDTINGIIADLNAILPSSVQIRTTTGDDYNAAIMITPKDTFNDYSPIYVEGANGFVCVWKNHNSEITSAQILIASELSGDKRKHVIREELTQSLGILNDSWTHADSIFYQGRSLTTEYAQIDKSILSILYSDTIEAGMSYDMILSLFQYTVASL
mgnify:CR=1 FL=1